MFFCFCFASIQDGSGLGSMSSSLRCQRWTRDHHLEFHRSVRQMKGEVENSKSVKNSNVGYKNWCANTKKNVVHYLIQCTTNWKLPQRLSLYTLSFYGINSSLESEDKLCKGLLFKPLVPETFLQNPLCSSFTLASCQNVKSLWFLKNHKVIKDSL